MPMPIFFEKDNDLDNILDKAKKPIVLHKAKNPYEIPNPS